VLPDLPPLEWLAVARGAAATTPLVVYSGAVHLDELKGLAHEWRVAAVLAKPFSPAELGGCPRGDRDRREAVTSARLYDALPADVRRIG
jgi:hypothetical protein